LYSTALKVQALLSSFPPPSKSDYRPRKVWKSADMPRLSTVAGPPKLAKSIAYLLGPSGPPRTTHSP